MADDALTTQFPTLTRTQHDGAYVISSPGMASTTRYQVGNPIGRGGMADVLAAHDMLIGRDVAIKRIRGEVPDSMLDRFMREACIQGRLDHPAIVPVHELGVDRDGVPFFVMKRLAGTTLAAILANPDPIKHSRQRLLRAFVEICLAIEFAHTRGYIHRDLKPDNIVLGGFGEAYVIDWGIAKIIGQAETVTPGGAPEMEGGGLAPTPGTDPSATRDGMTIGTPGYMSPEQARASRDLDGRVDVYALGCVLFEILAGQRLHPIGEEGMYSAIRGIDARPSLRAPNRNIAPELDAICVAATEIKREDRPASARVLAELVERYLDGDRDLELRKKLAREQLDAATEAFGASDVTESRRTAMRLAGRALALDPTLLPAAELVGRLMLEPPRDVPSEVVKSIAEESTQAARRTARIGMFAHGGYIAILAMLLWVGFRTPAYPIVFASLIVLNVALLAWHARSQTPRNPLPLLLASAAIVALLARTFSPFFVAPGVAAVTAMAFTLGVMPATRSAAALTIAITASAVLAPWAIEAAGWLSPSFNVTPQSIEILSPGIQGEESPHASVFALYTIALVAAAVLMANAVRRADGSVRQRLHLQAWQLRQLVPIKDGPED